MLKPQRCVTPNEASRRAMNVPVPVEASVAALLAAFDGLGDAVAVGSDEEGHVLGTSQALDRLVSRAEHEPPADWQAMLARLRALCADQASGCTLSESPLPDGRRLARVTGCRRDVQTYLAERDDLFLTSRTVSVSEMAATLAHELNQPLGTLANLLAALKIRHRRDTLTAQVLSTAIDDACEQTRFAQSVIARIRDFTAARQPELRPLDLAELVDRSVALLDWLLRDSGTQVRLRGSGCGVRVHGDRTMLQQVLINLLRNAVEAMRGGELAGRRIDVIVDSGDGRATLAIVDRGQGVEGSESTLFVPFVSGKPDGMGVGLNICRSFLELHQGRLWLTGNDHGGCTAHVELPLMRGGSA